MVSIYHFVEYDMYVTLMYVHVCISISAAFICVTAAGYILVVSYSALVTLVNHHNSGIIHIDTITLRLSRNQH